MFTYRPCHICGEQTIGLYMEPALKMMAGVPVCEDCYSPANRSLLDAEYRRVNTPESPAKRILASAKLKVHETKTEEDHDEQGCVPI